MQTASPRYGAGFRHPSAIVSRAMPSSAWQRAPGGPMRLGLIVPQCPGGLGRQKLIDAQVIAEQVLAEGQAAQQQDQDRQRRPGPAPQPSGFLCPARMSPPSSSSADAGQEQAQGHVGLHRDHRPRRRPAGGVAGPPGHQPEAADQGSARPGDADAPTWCLRYLHRSLPYSFATDGGGCAKWVACPAIAHALIEVLTYGDSAKNTSRPLPPLGQGDPASRAFCCSARPRYSRLCLRRRLARSRRVRRAPKARKGMQGELNRGWRG